MLFNSWEFAIFLPVVLLLYYCLARPAQNVLLLIAGYVFYGWWDWRFLGLLAFSTLLDYSIGVALGPTSDPRRRRQLIAVSVIANLSFLGFFKYFNFFVDSFGHVAAALGMRPDLPTLRIVLPVGISFYTFQSLAYTIDVYRGVYAAERNLVTYATYVAYFPQLVAGPIERAPNLLTQLKRPRVVDGDAIYSGCMLALIGFFKKMAIADSIAPLVERAFAHPHDGNWPLLLEGAWLFAIQIYCDFSGYTDIARGVSRLFGIELRENFNQPYLSTNITEFWRRWHISLSTWLRDYLYIPLGGNRHGRFNTYRNLMLTMLLGGLWHGASWTYVIWGGLHGIYLSAHKLFTSKTRANSTTLRSPGRESGVPPRDDARMSRPSFGTTFLSLLLTLNLVVLAWIFFRSPSLAAAMQYLHGIVTLRGAGATPASNAKLGAAGATVAFYAAMMLALDLPQFLRRDHLAMLRWPWPARGVAIAAMLLLIVALAPNRETPFIYFQF